MDTGGWERMLGPDPTPDELTRSAEEVGRLLELLGDKDLRRVALWKLEGFTNKEIADKLKRSVATVERKLERIRSIWEKEAAP
jgi:DNA-directed RNA polymerase specialized sigma24 family protein